MSQENPLIPVGVWIRLHLPDSKPVIGYTYFDQQAGFSAKGETEDAPDFSNPRTKTVRLPSAWCPWEALTDQECKDRALPASPVWITFYGPQPPRGTLWGHWREHPSLRGRFHEEYPDDTQVYVHDGGPRIVPIPPEYVWVRVTGFTTHPIGDVFTGVVLNQPHQLQTVKQYQTIQFLVPPDFPYAIMVTDKYLAERETWTITICAHCKFSELFDAPSDLRRKAFPNAPQGENYQTVAFGTFCPACAAPRVLKRRNSPDDPYICILDTKTEHEPRTPFAVPFPVQYHRDRQAVADEQQGERKWWQFWRRP